jgi:hypothetical protein
MKRKQKWRKHILGKDSGRILRKQIIVNQNRGLILKDQVKNHRTYF